MLTIHFSPCAKISAQTDSSQPTRPGRDTATSRARAQLCSVPFSGDEKLLHRVVDLQSNLKSRENIRGGERKRRIFYFEKCARKMLPGHGNCRVNILREFEMDG